MYHLNSKKIAEEKLKHLKITDDLVFRNVIEMGDNCLHLLQAIYPELNIKEVSFETQKHEKKSYDERGTILDLFASDGKNVFDIEVQTTLTPWQDKRFLYYQGKNSDYVINSGESFQKIKPLYIAVLFTQDPIGKNKKYYRFGMCDLEDRDIKLDAGVELLYLNPLGKQGKVSRDLQALYDMINGKINLENNFVNDLQSGINEISQDPEWRAEFMNLQMRYDDIKYEATKEATEKATEATRIEAVKELISTLKSLGHSNEEIKENVFKVYKQKLPQNILQKVYDEATSVK